MNHVLSERVGAVDGPRMARRFPGFLLKTGGNGEPFAPNGEPYWCGRLRTRLASVYELAVVYPLCFPRAALAAYAPELRHIPIPFKGADGRLWLFPDDRLRGREWLDVATVVDKAARWFDAFDRFLWSRERIFSFGR